MHGYRRSTNPLMMEFTEHSIVVLKSFSVTNDVSTHGRDYVGIGMLFVCVSMTAEDSPWKSSNYT